MLPERCILTRTATGTNTRKNCVIPSGVNRSLGERFTQSRDLLFAGVHIRIPRSRMLRPGRRESPRLVESAVTVGVLRLRKPIRKRIGMLRSG